MPTSSPASIQTGTQTIVSGDGVTVNILISAVNVANAVIMYTLRHGDAGSRLKRHIFRAELTSSTNLRLIRAESAFATTIVVSWTVLEFTSGDVTIQTGSIDALNATESVTISSVVLANTFPITSMTTIKNTRFADVAYYSDIATATNIDFVFAATPIAGEAVIQYQIIESTGFSVQSGGISLTPGNESNTAAISAIDLSKTFIINAGLKSDAGSGIDNRAIARLKFNSPTVVQADRSTAGTDPTLTAFFYVVELSGGQAVENFDVIITDTNAVPATQPSWTALSTANTCIMTGDPWANNRGDNVSDTTPDSRQCSVVLNAGADGVTVTRIGTITEVELTGFAVDWSAGVAPAGSLLAAATSAAIFGATAAAVSAVTEGSTAGDTPGSTAAAQAAIAEGSTAAEIQAALAAAQAAITQGMASGAAWTADGAIVASILGAALAGDTFTGVLPGAVPGAISGGSSSQAQFLSAAATVALLASGAQTADVMAAVALTSAALLSGTQAAATVANTARRLSAVSSGAAASDTVTAAADMSSPFTSGALAGAAFDIAGEIGNLVADIIIQAALDAVLLVGKGIDGDVTIN